MIVILRGLVLVLGFAIDYATRMFVECRPFTKFGNVLILTEL